MRFSPGRFQTLDTGGGGGGGGGITAGAATAIVNSLDNERIKLRPAAELGNPPTAAEWPDPTDGDVIAFGYDDNTLELWQNVGGGVGGWPATPSYTLGATSGGNILRFVAGVPAGALGNVGDQALRIDDAGLGLFYEKTGAATWTQRADLGPSLKTWAPGAQYRAGEMLVNAGSYYLVTGSHTAPGAFDGNNLLELSSRTSPVRITKNGHGLALGQAVNFEIDGSDVVLTNSDENEFNGVLSNVVDPNTVEIAVPGQQFTWTAHGFTDEFLYLSATGTWVPASEGAFPIVGLQILDANTVSVMAVPVATPGQLFTTPADVNVGRDFALSDVGLFLQVQSVAAITMTIRLASAVAFPIGTELELQQTGAGLLTIAVESGVTLNPLAPVNSNGIWSIIGIKQVALNVWTAYGGIA